VLLPSFGDPRKLPDGTAFRRRPAGSIPTLNIPRWRDLPKSTIAQVQGYKFFVGYMRAFAMA
jgi:hypothetical protein